MPAKKRAFLQNYADATQHEWLETNGLGGWSSSTLIGANTRRYHGLLIAAIEPPESRMALLSKLDETIVTKDKRIEFGTNLYWENIIYPNGYQYLDKFTKDFFPQWNYDSEGIKIKKTIAMVHGENTVVIIYDVYEAPGSFLMDFLPLMAARNCHSLVRQGPQMHWDTIFENGIFHNQPDGKTDLFISIPGSSFRHSPNWYNNFQYSEEQSRELEFTEDLFNHGVFSVELKQGDSLGIIVSTSDPSGRNAHDLLRKEMMRRQLLITNQPDDEIVKQLVLAADQFIVKKEAELKTVIAGYHWLTGGARDTLISLPGLYLSTGRFKEAKEILTAFARSVNQGMLPNQLKDSSEVPEYNNVDITLWYFIAVRKYLESTGDKDFILNEILPALKEIIDWHFNGTRHNIHVAEDGLLSAGEEGQPLTWMDARVDDWIATPRMGKPVEVQALWYNALRIFAEFLQLNQQEDDAGRVNNSAEKAKQSFGEQFWNAEGNYLYDNIDKEGNPVAQLRPNQLFAIGLPFPLIEGERAKSVLSIVAEQLYTPVGLKTLAKNDPNYIPVYIGDSGQRDAAYHNGTVWSWLLGPFVDAIIKVQGREGRELAMELINNFSYHLNEACIGSVSEIFDAEPPHHPRGCIAQARGVAEVLRVIKENGLYDHKMEKVELKMEEAKV